MTATMTFRNLDIEPEAPVEEWGVAGILTALERGGITQWRAIAAAVMADPWGRAARQLQQALTCVDADSGFDESGVVYTMRQVVTNSRSRAEADERRAVAGRVRDMVDRSGLAAGEFASCVGTSASRLSTYMSGKVCPSAAMMLRMERVSSTIYGRTTARG